MEFGPTIPARTAPQARERRPVAVKMQSRGDADSPDGAPPGNAGLQTRTAAHRAAKLRNATGEEARGRLGTPTSGQFSRWGPAPRGSAKPALMTPGSANGSAASPFQAGGGERADRHQHADRPPWSPLLPVHQRRQRSSVPRRISLSPAGAPEAAPRRPRRAAPCRLRSDGRRGRAS